jgi:hypothetical protein
MMSKNKIVEDNQCYRALRLATIAYCGLKVLVEEVYLVQSILFAIIDISRRRWISSIFRTFDTHLFLASIFSAA